MLKYKKKNRGKNPRVCLSFRIERAILNELKEEVTNEQFENIVLNSYALVYPVDVIKATAYQLVQRVIARITELQTPVEKSKSRKQSKSFGTSFAGSLIALEASMYGFGGKYADDIGGSSANENVIDLSDSGARDAFAGEKVGHAFETLSRYGVVANVIYAVAGAMKSLAASTIEFEDLMKSIQAITASSNSDMATISESIKETARDTAFSISEIAGAVKLVASQKPYTSDCRRSYCNR